MKIVVLISFPFGFLCHAGMARRCGAPPLCPSAKGGRYCGGHRLDAHIRFGLDRMRASWPAPGGAP